MVKLLGIDYGDARTGLAYSDDLGSATGGVVIWKTAHYKKCAVTEENNSIT